MNGILNSYREKLKPFGHDNLDIFIQADPTGKKYVRWIVDSYVNGGIKRDEDLLSRVKPALENYEYLKTRNILVSSGQQWEQETNIDNFCGIVGCTKKGFEKPGLEDLIDKYKDQLEVEEVETSNTAVQVYNGDTLRIIQPTTEADACYYGQSTRWCTAAKNDNMFNEYNKSGPLYIIIPKQPSYKDEKYQLSFETEQYMDEKDEPVKLEDLVAKYPEITIGLFEYFTVNYDLDNAKLAFYNARRAVKQENLYIFNQIAQKYPFLDFKKILKYINTSEFLDYFRNVLNINFDCNLGMEGDDELNMMLEKAVETHRNFFFDAYWNQCKDEIIKNKYKKELGSVALEADNLYVYKKLGSNNKSRMVDLRRLIRYNRPSLKILNYILKREPLDISSKNNILEILQDNAYAITNEPTLVAKTPEKEIVYKNNLNAIIDILFKYNVLDNDLVRDYVISKNAHELLNFINLDSRSVVEIASTVK
jgi:hypothetical protein